MVWIEFILSAAIITFAAMQLAKYGDVIGLRTGLGGMFVGTLLLAAATSLPELITTISAIQSGVPNLAAGNLFGSNMFNMFLIAVLDMVHTSRRMSSKEAYKHALTGSLAVLMIVLAVFFIVAEMPLHINVGGFEVGLDALTMIIVYFFAIALLRRQSRIQSLGYVDTGIPEGLPSLSTAILWFAGAAGVLIFATPWMVDVSTRIAEITGLGTTFIGSTLVAFVTSLPETVATIEAGRIGADDMAISNLYGSNMFNMFAIGIADFFYIQGRFFSVIDRSFLLIGMLGLLMTVVALISDLARLERKILFLEIDSALLILLYFGGLALLYTRGLAP
jgi:cation:H+ antiporter